LPSPSSRKPPTLKEYSLLDDPDFSSESFLVDEGELEEYLAIDQVPAITHLAFEHKGDITTFLDEYSEVLDCRLATA